MTLPLSDFTPLLADALTVAAPPLTTPAGPATVPLALLPVRLETRFADLADGTVELRVRIYPDKIHIDSHDPALTADEADAGHRYWQAQWQAGADENLLRQAWQQLTDRYDPGRCVWIARATTPTNAADRSPTGTAQFADPGPPRGAQRIPVARLLPTRWTATAYRGGQVVAAGAGADVRPDLAVAPDIDAVVTVTDDAAAIDPGMRWMIDFAEAEAAGMALRLPLDSTAEVDVLLVCGVCDGTDHSARFAALLDAHQYADGLAFVAPGTPSNNTSGERAGYASRDPLGVGSFAVETQTAPAAGCNADVTARALGVDAATFAVEGGTDIDVAAAMTTALWPATWGYYLTQFAGVSPDGADWVREHAREFVRPGGNLPVLRCGRQPYGLLPVTGLGRFTSGDARLNRIRELVLGLRDHVFRPVVSAVPRVGRSTDPNGDIIDVLRTDAMSGSVLTRRVTGPQYLRNLRRFLGQNLDELNYWTALQTITGSVAQRVGVGQEPFGAWLVFQDGTRPITVPFVGDPDYLAELSAVTDPEPLARPVPDQPVPLLHALLRHALLRTYAEAAARLLATPALVRDPELVDVQAGQPPAPTWTWQRSQQVPGSTQTVAEALANGNDAALADFREALRDLSAAGPDVLEPHLRQHLDATSHRLDAWATSLAARRLHDLRTSTANGVVVGGYGWVEGLRRESRGAVADLPPDEPGPLSVPDADPGFIHAPSLNQAGAAALLRNAHLAHGGAADDPFAMQLTSGQVRSARRLFDGVRQGQSLGTLLGYDVERRLHDAQLDDLIIWLRGIAHRPGDNGYAARRDGHPIDGLVLHQKWSADPQGLLALLPPDVGDRLDKLRNVLAALEVAVDGLSDAVTAESVHQLARGNLTRSAISLDAIAGGDAAPPPLDFLRTPRSGLPVSHRVAVLVDVDLPLPAGWSEDSPRARAEPVLNAWAGQLLGPAPSELAGVAPLDFLAETDAPPSDLRTVAAGVRELIAGARGLDGADLQPPHAEPQPGLDLDEYESRAAAAQAALAAATPAQAGAFGIAAGPLEGPAGALIAAAVQAEIDRRVGEADTYATAPDGETPQARRERVQRRFTAVFGAGFVAVPRFRCSTAVDVAASLADATLTDDPLAVDTWLLRMERLRPALARFGTAVRQAQVLAGVTSSMLDLAQVPHVPGQRWVGLPLNGTPLREGVVSLALHGAPADLTATLAGLLVDEWTEIIPATSETTGVAFRYDPPDAMAPQAILLAVPPVLDEQWTVGTLNQVLLETLDLAHLRPIGPDLLGDAGQYLPAAMLAFNAVGDAVSTDLNPLTR